MQGETTIEEAARHRGRMIIGIVILERSEGPAEDWRHAEQRGPSAAPRKTGSSMPLYRWALNARRNARRPDGGRERRRGRGGCRSRAICRWRRSSPAKAAASRRGTLFKPSPSPASALVQFTQQLATLLGAGQPLDRAAGILLELPEDALAKRTIGHPRRGARRRLAVDGAGAPARHVLAPVREHGPRRRGRRRLHDTPQRLADSYLNAAARCAAG